jgi:hypothetical protein
MAFATTAFCVQAITHWTMIIDLSNPLIGCLPWGMTLVSCCVGCAAPVADLLTRLTARDALFEAAVRPVRLSRSTH